MKRSFEALFTTSFSIMPLDGGWVCRAGYEIIAIDEDRTNLLNRCKASTGLLTQAGGNVNIHVHDVNNKIEATLNFYGTDPNAVEEDD